MRRYESLFILNPELTQEETKEVVDKFQQIVTRNNGKMIMTNPMGIRKLSFDIQKQSRGFYVLMDYGIEPETIREVERNFRIDERVLNYQTIKLQNAITDEEIEALIASLSGKPMPSEEIEVKPPRAEAASDSLVLDESEPKEAEEAMNTSPTEEPLEEGKPEESEDAPDKP